MINQPRSIHEHTHDHAHLCLKCISWTALFTGALVGTGLSFLLNLFSIAIGLSVYTTTTAGATSIAVGGLLGMAIGVIVAMFISGFVAGYLGRSHCKRRHLGVLYGFTTWCLALIITVLLTASMGRYVASYSDFIAHPAMIVVAGDAMPLVNANKMNSHPDVVKAEKATHNLGIGTFVVFLLFAIGAFFSSLGGHCGMGCRDDDKETY
jgi:hypothetical protein